jgi:hypothetical protein
MNNMIPDMTLGPFVIKPVACGLFYTKDRASKDKRNNHLSPSTYIIHLYLSTYSFF